MKILALDLETTGLSPDYDYITQLAVAIMEDGQVLDAFHVKVRPDMERFRISAGALTAQVGNFVNEPIKTADWLTALFSAPEPGDAWGQLVKWATGKQTHLLPVVAHNMAFDHGFVHKRVLCFKTVFGLEPVFGATWVDTLTMAKIADPGKRSYALDACLERVGLPARPAEHDAMQDAILAGQLHHKLTEKL